MKSTLVPRLGWPTVVIGVLIIAASVWAGGMGIKQILAGQEALIEAPGRASAAIGEGAITVLIALAVALIGYLLTLVKKVWKCKTCGYIIDRA